MDFNDPVYENATHALINVILGGHVVGLGQGLAAFFLHVLGYLAQVFCHLLTVVLLSICLVDFVGGLVAYLGLGLGPELVQAVLHVGVLLAWLLDDDRAGGRAELVMTQLVVADQLLSRALLAHDWIVMAHVSLGVWHTYDELWLWSMVNSPHRHVLLMEPSVGRIFHQWLLLVSASFLMTLLL